MLHLEQKWTAFIIPLGLLALFVFTGCKEGVGVSSQPPIHWNPNMDNQKRLDPQEPSKFFKDKRAMRPLVKGTVARGFLREDDHLYRGKVNGKFATTLPKSIALNRKLLARGQERYNIFCSPCHAYSGNGKGVVTKYSKAINPANLHDELRRKMPPGQIYDLIANGKTNAQGMIQMPAYNNQLSVRDRWAVVAYVRALQLGNSAAAPQKKGKK